MPNEAVRQVILIKNISQMEFFVKLHKIYTVIVSLVCMFSFLFSSNVQALGEDIPEGLAVQVHYAQHEGALWATVELDIADTYYAYAPQSSTGLSVNSGQATQLFVPSPTGSPLPVYIPWGVERDDYYEKGKRISAQMGKVYLFVNLGAVQDFSTEKAPILGKLSLLLCSTKHCLPVRLPMQFAPPQDVPSLESQPYVSQWKQSVERGATPQPHVESLVVRQEQAENESSAPTQGLAAGLASLKANSINDVTHQSLHAPLSSLSAPVKAQSATWSFSPQPYTQDLEVSSLTKALVFGLLAGLILNLMPCVLPVLTLKIQSLLLTNEGEARTQAFRTHNIYFAAGILTQFFLLGVILGSLGLMWGELFQSTLFVTAMLVIIFVLALSLFGVFTLPMFDMKSTQHASPQRQAFVTGMVATLLATPCSGPLLGGVLSWAFLQPLHYVILIIMAVGCGMALPYLLFAWQPQWVRFMPKPGAWMVLVEKLVAFFLLGTTLYIFSILPTYAHIPVLVGLLVLAVLAWLWGHFGGLSAPKWRRRALASVFIVAMALVVVQTAQEPTISATSWQNFSSKSFQASLGKQPLVVEFTADWCPNCKYVEKTVLTPENLAEWQKKYGVHFIKVDITRDNHDGEALLHALGSRSIPFTAVFGTGEAAQKPVVLRDIYTQESLEGALQQVFK